MSEAAHADPLIGTEFVGRYRIDSVLGRGGMGAVYRATQLGVGRSVALKVLLPSLAQDEKVVRRFENEAKTIAALHHPNIIGLHDFGKDAEGRLFLVMEFVEGEPLSSLVRREGALAPARVVRIIRQVLDALAEAHHAGVVHRDLKPENLFVVDAGGRRKDTIKVLDFGIAKIAGPEAQDTQQMGQLTATGIVIGSALYMAPEQARAEPVSGQTDLYSLGAVMYELLAGRPMFEGRGLTQLLVAHVMETPQPIVTPAGELAGPLVDLMFKCLEKAPADRPAGADAMIAALEALPAEPVQIVAATGATRSVMSPGAYAKLTQSDTGVSRATSSLPSAPAPKSKSKSKSKSFVPWLVAGVVLVGGGVAGVIAATSGSGAQPRATETVVAHVEPKPEPKPEPAAPKPEPVVAKPEPVVKPEPKPEPAAPKPEPVVAQPTPTPAPAPTPVVAAKTLTVVVDSPAKAAHVFVGTDDLGTVPRAVSWLDNEPLPAVSLRLGSIEKAVPLALTDAGSTKSIPIAKKKVAAGTPEPPPDPGFKMIE